ncbi:ankyrin [Daldinia grandis]|nr:ankyrin [Daldinia grandis]
MAKITNLPCELLQMIAACDNLRRSDLASIALTNKQLHYATNGILYRTFGSPAAIKFAAGNGMIDTLELALFFGLDIHYDYDQPLRHACEKGQIEAIKWLLNHGSSVDTEQVSGTFVQASHSPLFTALRCRKEDAALLLLTLGATPRFDFRSPFPSYNIFPRLSYHTALHIAVQLGMMRVVEFLICKHVQPVDESIRGSPPALVLLIRGDPRGSMLGTFKKLIELGANITQYPDGEVPFILALSCGQYDYAEALLDAGVMINSRSTDPRIQHPVHACVQGAGEDFIAGCAMLSRLVEAGADLEESYLGGNTPLGEAVETGPCRMVSHLLSLGVRVDGRNTSGHTPLDVLVESMNYLPEQDPDKLLALMRGGARIDTALFDGRTLLERIIRDDWTLSEIYNVPSSTDLLQQLLAAATPAVLNNEYLDELLYTFFEPRYYRKCAILTSHGATLKHYDEAYSTARNMISAYEELQTRDSENRVRYFEMIARAGLPAEKFDELIAYAREVGDEEGSQALLSGKASSFDFGT